MGNPFDALLGQRRDRAVATDGKPQAPYREPVSHEHRADQADQGAGHDVAWVMGQEYQPSEGDHEGVGDHHAPHPWPDRAYRESQGKGRDGVRRGEAEIRFSSGEGDEVEGVGLAPCERAATSDDPFQHLAGEQRHQHRAEQILKTQAKTLQPRSRRASHGHCNQGNDKQRRRQYP